MSCISCEAKYRCPDAFCPHAIGCNNYNKNEIDNYDGKDMEIKDGKIVSATNIELYAYWLKSGWSDIYSYTEYKNKVKQLGTKVIENDGN